MRLVHVECSRVLLLLQLCCSFWLQVSRCQSELPRGNYLIKKEESVLCKRKRGLKRREMIKGREKETELRFANITNKLHEILRCREWERGRCHAWLHAQTLTDGMSRDARVKRFSTFFFFSLALSFAGPNFSMNHVLCIYIIIENEALEFNAKPFCFFFFRKEERYTVLESKILSVTSSQSRIDWPTNRRLQKKKRKNEGRKCAAHLHVIIIDKPHFVRIPYGHSVRMYGASSNWLPNNLRYIYSTPAFTLERLMIALPIYMLTPVNFVELFIYSIEAFGRAHVKLYHSTEMTQGNRAMCNCRTMPHTVMKLILLFFFIFANWQTFWFEEFVEQFYIESFMRNECDLYIFSIQRVIDLWILYKRSFLIAISLDASQKLYRINRE